MVNGEKEEKKEVSEKKEEVQSKQKIELDPEQYNALLDSVAELEAIRATKPKKEEEEDDDVASLAREGKRGKVKEQEVKEEPLDLDNLTNSQLAQAILKEIDRRNEERLNPLEVTVETLRMLRDIDKAEGKHEDFWTYGDKIQKMCLKDPNLSVEDAYILAKSKTPTKKEKEGEHEEVKTTRTERLLKLPPRVHGEKPGVAVSSTEHIEKGKTLRAAAEKAWDDTIGKGKTSI